MGEDDGARSEVSFQSADDEDYFDLPQDLAHGEAGRQAAPAGAASGGANPPGLNDADGSGAERWNLRRDGNREQLQPIWQRLSDDREHVKISKMFSYVLRHAAHKLDVRIRKDGFVRLREIMKLSNFKTYNLEELMAVVYFDEKERYTMVREFDGELLIRANQGHTMKVVEDDLLLETVTDPSQISECVHGTYLVHWPFIKRQGLSKVARNHIHMANGLPEDGKIRGMRSTAELFVYVDVAKAMEDGVVFMRSKNDVILTQGFDGWLPAKYFRKAERIDYNTCEIEELEFDGDADMPSWPAELAPSGPGEQGAYLVKNLEALIGNCRKRIADINELKALQESGQELTEDEQERVDKHAQVYTELQSLEQRFRQHKGFRRETEYEREKRAKEEAEAGTVVKRKDRAVTPPWERNKSQLESVGTKATEKEKAEWAALGRRRDGAPAPPPAKKSEKSDDPWAALGRGRQGAQPPTPSAAATPSGGGPRGGAQKPLGREESWRFSQREEGRRGDEETTPAGRPSGTPQGGGPPRFFNSKKSADGSSWRDRMTQPQVDGGPPSRGAAARPQAEEPPAFQEPPGSRDQAPSWREAMAEVRSSGDSWRDPPPTSQGAREAMAAGVPASAQFAPSAAQPMVGMSMPSNVGRAADGAQGSYLSSMQRWDTSQQQGGQMAGYGMGQSQVYYAAPSPGQGGSMPVMANSWMGGQAQQYAAYHEPSGGMGMQQGYGGYGYQYGGDGYGGAGASWGGPQQVGGGGCGGGFCYPAPTGPPAGPPHGLQQGGGPDEGLGGTGRRPSGQDGPPAWQAGGGEDWPPSSQGHGPGRGFGKGGKAGGKGGFGKDRGGDDQDWAALGRMRAST